MPTRSELERFFFLDDDDRALIALRRTDARRLGMAVQICTVRYTGRLLGEDPLAVPWETVEYLAEHAKREVYLPRPSNRPAPNFTALPGSEVPVPRTEALTTR